MALSTAQKTGPRKSGMPGQRLSPADRRKLQELLTLSQKHAAEGDVARSARYLVEAWNMDPHDFDLLIAVSDSLVQLGARGEALALLEQALALHGAHSDMLAILGNLAIDLEMPDMMEKIFRVYIALKPDDPMGYNNLASALEKQDRLDDAIALLKDILPLFPENAAMWNTLGSAVAARDGYEAAIPFYSEAYRLAPRHYNILNNLSLAFEHTGNHEEAIRFARKAIKVNPRHSYAHIGLATSLLTIGELAEGWREYEWRQDPQRPGSIIFPHKIPRWKGQALEGKKLLVGPEQGVGDEILFALSYRGLAAEGAKLFIGCDRRLVSLYARSFPDAVIGHYRDGIRNGYRYRSLPDLEAALAGERDALFIECGSVPLHRWKRREQLPDFPDGFLVPDPERLALWESRLAALGPRPRIGIYWRSGKQNSARNKNYAQISSWEPIFTRFRDRVHFVNLQYGDCAEELAEAKERYGVTIHHFEDADLRNDLETVAALSRAVDLAIGPASAPGMFSFSVGTPTWWLLPIRPWWCFGEPDRTPFFSKGRLFVGQVDNPWPDIMGRLGEALEAFVAERR